MTKKKAPKIPKVSLEQGRPEFPHSIELEDEICEAIATTHHGLEHICKKHPNFPKPRTIYKWCFTKEGFSQKYELARQKQQDVMVEYMMKKAKNKKDDFYMDGDGQLKPNPVNVSRSKLIVDTIKWQAARLNRKYSDKVDIAVHDGNKKAAKEIQSQIDKMRKNERPF